MVSTAASFLYWLIWLLLFVLLYLSFPSILSNNLEFDFSACQDNLVARIPRTFPSCEFNLFSHCKMNLFHLFNTLVDIEAILDYIFYLVPFFSGGCHCLESSRFWWKVVDWYYQNELLGDKSLSNQMFHHVLCYFSLTNN